MGELSGVYKVDTDPHRVGNECQLRERSRITDSEQTGHHASTSTGRSSFHEERCGEYCVVCSIQCSHVRYYVLKLGSTSFQFQWDHSIKNVVE